ncbi:hypothetical protein FSP39_003411 [Pinctada imbricata]|uniref:Uncharacterized protein n=1 Tax=Pinctada imbricata TaxID=66713 RepID=A0AA88XKS1_PINIB|nr:hypothetical protein FSP39_003411 [Pinctada imbricata]
MGNRCRLWTAICHAISKWCGYPGLRAHNPLTSPITQRSRRTYNCGVKQPPHYKYSPTERDFRTLLQDIRELIDVKHKIKDVTYNPVNEDVDLPKSDDIADDPVILPIGLTKTDPFDLLSGDDEIIDNDYEPNNKVSKKTYKWVPKATQRQTYDNENHYRS